MVPLNQQPEEPPPPVPAAARQEPEKNSDRIQAVQVDQRPDVKQTESRISQIPSGPDTDAILQSAIVVDDPCLGDLQKSEQCRSNLKPKSTGADAAGDSSMTLTVVAPDTGLKGTFDASRAVDEIGRGRIVSQGAQSAGSDFLSGAATPQIEPPLPDLPISDLPPGSVTIQPQ